MEFGNSLRFTYFGRKTGLLEESKRKNQIYIHDKFLGKKRLFIEMVLRS
jgi:hypothetical protein